MLLYNLDRQDIADPHGPQVFIQVGTPILFLPERTEGFWRWQGRDRQFIGHIGRAMKIATGGDDRDAHHAQRDGQPDRLVTAISTQRAQLPAR